MFFQHTHQICPVFSDVTGYDSFIYDQSNLYGLMELCHYTRRQRWGVIVLISSVCLSGFTQATLYTTTTVYGVMQTST